MNIISLIQAQRTAIKNNAALAAWCATNYGKAVKVFIGIDESNPPGEADYPLVHLFPVSKEAGAAVEERPHLVGATCGLCDETAAVNDEMLQLGKLEAFRVLVQAAILTAIPDGMLCNRIHIEYETVGVYPFFLATSELTFDQPWECRENPNE